MMSLDKEVPIKVSPAYPSTVSLSEQPQQARTGLCAKNGLQLSGNSQPTLTAPAAPAHRIGKRRYSMGVGFKGMAKRRRRVNSESQSEPMLPSHFLLGGNIFDPLNLNSLLDEDVNKVTNQETPKCSPLPSRGGDPVEILVPRDITDPLNLKGGGKEGGEGVLLSPLKSRRRHRNRHHGGGGAGDGEKEVIPAQVFPSTGGLTVPLLTREGSVPPSPLPCELNTAITCRDDVAPPPILPRRHTHPLPGHATKPGNQGDGRQRRRRRTTSTRSADGAISVVATVTTAPPTKFQTPLVGGSKATRCGGPQSSSGPPPERKKDKYRYQYGNHSRYYGYHGFYGDGWEGRVGVEEDPRLRLLEADWFRDKTVLDVGCGAGHMTLTVARRFDPAHILGVELDKWLVHSANQNVRHFLSHDLVVEERRRRRGATVLAYPPKERGQGGEMEVQKKNEGELKQEEVMEEKNNDEVKQEEAMEEKNNDEKQEEAMEEKNNDEKQEEAMEEKNNDEKQEEAMEEKNNDEKQEEAMEEKNNDEKQEEAMGELQQAVSLLSFPLSFRVSRGPLSAPLLLHPPSSSSSRFPNNVTFIQGDYVSEREAWPGQGQYDVIMCLGVTKWVQLQSGDGGVVRLFRRAYQSLSPGGLFLLQPQPWSSYGHSKRASETTYRNYRTLRLRPEQFTSYLTDGVGFTSYRLLTHTGNKRPIYLFHKGPAQRK